MKKLLLIISFISAAIVSEAQVTVNFFLQAGTMNTAAGVGNPIPDGDGLVLLVGDINGDGFSAPTPSSSLTEGSSFESDDRLLQKFSVSGISTDGLLSQTTASYSLNVSTDLILYWFPDRDTSSLSLVGGDAYGSYRNDSIVDSSIAWSVPGGGLHNLFFKTVDVGGSNANIAGNPTLTVVPEPSTYAALFGLALLTGAVASRRRRQR